LEENVDLICMGSEWAADGMVVDTASDQQSSIDKAWHCWGTHRNIAFQPCAAHVIDG
jgi:hypothetical protein